MPYPSFNPASAHRFHVKSNIVQTVQCLPFNPKSSFTEHLVLSNPFKARINSGGCPERRKMESVPLRLVRATMIVLFLWNSIAVAGKEYVRPGPRPLVTMTKRDRGASDEDDPEQVHISMVGKDHMRVTWLSSNSSLPSKVEYGLSPGDYGFSATGDNPSHYWFFFYKSDYIYNVVIGPLLPDTVYYYRCGGRGQEFSLKTPPQKFPITFAVVGDPGQTGWTKTTLQHVKESGYDMLLLPGDLSYADMHQCLWDSFGRLVEPLASSRPWMVTEGNHEIESIPLLMPHSFRAYNARWRMPYEVCNSSSNLYYSFDVAGVHVLMLGSYTDFDSDSDQYKWLQADLKRVDRGKTPWVIALLHAPWYNTNEAHEGEGEKMRKALESVLFFAQVDIVFAGHVHAYERFTRIYNNTANACGPIYMTVGDGGNREGLAEKFKTPQSNLSLFREASFGHGILQIYNSNEAKWTWHRNQNDTRVAADSVRITSLSAGCSASANRHSASSSHSRDEL